MKPTYEELEKAAKDVVEDWKSTNETGVCIQHGTEHNFVEGKIMWNSLRVLKEILEIDEK